jgi:sulfite exporter TauE/SafE
VTVLDSREKYVRFTGRLCVVTGVALLAIGLAVAVRGEWPSAAVWCAAGVVLIVWGRWRLKSARR